MRGQEGHEEGGWRRRKPAEGEAKSSGRRGRGRRQRTRHEEAEEEGEAEAQDEPGREEAVQAHGDREGEARHKAFKRHILTKKATGRKRGLRKAVLVSDADTPNVRRMLLG